MITIDLLQQWLGWSLLINLILLMLTALAVVFGRSWIIPIHSRMFDIEPARLVRIYFGYIAIYKILIIVFNLVPYLALRVIT